MTHLLLEGLQGRYEVEAMCVTETGIAPIELMETEQVPQLWSLTDEDHQQQPVYGDSLREVIQRWCKQEISDGLALLQKSHPQPYEFRSTQRTTWASEITETTGVVIARFKYTKEASRWFSMLNAVTSQQHEASINNYLTDVLPYANHHHRWWMPLTLRHQPFKPTPIQLGRLSLKADRQPPPPELWWEISSSSNAEHVIAEFRIATMAKAFSAAQLYRLTATYRELSPGATVAIKGGQSQATVVETPLLNQLAPSSMIKVRFKPNEVTQVEAQKLTWVMPNQSAANS